VEVIRAPGRRLAYRILDGMPGLGPDALRIDFDGYRVFLSGDLMFHYREAVVDGGRAILVGPIPPSGHPGKLDLEVGWFVEVEPCYLAGDIAANGDEVPAQLASAVKVARPPRVGRPKRYGRALVDLIGKQARIPQADAKRLILRNRAATPGALRQLVHHAKWHLREIGADYTLKCEGGESIVKVSLDQKS
jgi:hypothetical protein